MTNSDDRRAIEGLFFRLREVERRSPPRDREAEALIRDEISRQPAAPYYMAQTILVQEHALEIAERRIRELEEDLERAGRGYGRGVEQIEQPGPWDRAAQRERRDGGFLAGAAQTALGVTGVILIGNAIASLFGAGAAVAGQHQDSVGTEQDQDAEPGGGNEDGSDFGDFGDGGFGDGGGFDFGGGF